MRYLISYHTLLSLSRWILLEQMIKRFIKRKTTNTDLIKVKENLEVHYRKLLLWIVSLLEKGEKFNLNLLHASYWGEGFGDCSNEWDARFQGIWLSGCWAKNFWYALTRKDRLKVKKRRQKEKNDEDLMRVTINYQSRIPSNFHLA